MAKLAKAKSNLDQSNKQKFMSAVNTTRELKNVLEKIIKIENAESWRLLLLYEKESYQLTVK